MLFKPDRLQGLMALEIEPLVELLDPLDKTGVAPSFHPLLYPLIINLAGPCYPFIIVIIVTAFENRTPEEQQIETEPFPLKIDSLAYGPYGVGRHEGRVILVPFTAPADEALVRIVEERGNYATGELLRLIRPSPHRQEPPCRYFEQCGGCPWQQVRYETQLAAKEKNVGDALRRIGKLDGFDLLPILRSPQEYRYRRRIRLQVGRDGRLGFYRALSHDLIEIESCPISDPEVERRIEGAREWAQGLKTAIRHVEISSGDEQGEVVLAAKAQGPFAPEDDGASRSFLEAHGEIRGLILFGGGWRRSWGRAKIAMTPEEGLRLEMDGEVFSQVNREANRLLVRELIAWGEFSDRDRVLELYCGAGNFTLPVARRAKEVVAVEGNPRALENGKANGRANGRENIRWLSAHAPRAARQLRQRGESFSKVVLNPPRSGAKELAEGLASLGAEKILYVSCDPATLARDLAAIKKRGGRISRVRPFDLYPHTYHVETLAEIVL